MSNGGTPSSQPLGAIEPPDPWASMGRGVTDLYEPVMQTWLNATSPQQAAAYRKQRAEDERLYQRGLLGTTPSPGQAPPSDTWRTIGSQAVMAPLFATGLGGLSQLPRIEAAMSGALTSNAYDALGALLNPTANTRPPGWTPDLQASYDRSIADRNRSLQRLKALGQAMTSDTFPTP